jgi:hypothetical protein
MGVNTFVHGRRQDITLRAAVDEAARVAALDANDTRQRAAVDANLGILVEVVRIDATTA